MNGVVLRCPTCGTTQGHPGECDACTEGDVRYFCGNHTPGLWLDAPVCGECGARFGETPGSRSAPAPRPLPTPRVRKARPADVAAPRPDAVEPRPAVRKRVPPAAEPEPRSATPSLRETLDRLSEDSRWGSYDTAEEAGLHDSPAAPPRMASYLLGCLFRLALLVFLLILLAAAGLLLLFGGLPRP
jgi:hypothetical protein